MLPCSARSTAWTPLSALTSAARASNCSTNCPRIVDDCESELWMIVIVAGEIEPPTGARDQPSKRPNENARMCRGRCRDTLRLARNLNCARVSCAVRAWHGHTRAILLVTTVLRFKSFYGHIRSIFSPLSRVSVPVSQGSVWDPSIARPRAAMPDCMCSSRMWYQP